ncbi:4Fe-4S dicluster domain-containing protein, partial [Desulfotalea psychrophila]|nr:4Fe-4S dicluster domain-containing protein [Desulfotalea psychrophila]
LPLNIVGNFSKSAGKWYFIIRTASSENLSPRAGTLEAGLPLLILQPGLRESLGLLFLNKLFILSFFIVWSVFASRPFCRTACPLGAFYALFSKIKLVKLRLNTERCTQCEACHAVCPMGVHFNESPDDMECISCLACSKACNFNAISLEIGGVPLSNQAPFRPEKAQLEQ